MTYKQEPPFCIQVEFTEGCNLSCSMCGINGIRAKAGNFKFMTLEVARIVAQRIADAKWTSRIEFAMHGEPTMNPAYVQLVQAFRERLPKNQLMMETNGLGLTLYPHRGHAGKNIQALFAAGLNILALEDYMDATICAKVLTQASDDGVLAKDSLLFQGRSIPVYNYPVEQKGNPHRRIKPKDQFMSILDDIRRVSKGTHSVINNHAGCGAPPNQSLQGQRCGKPFREIGVRWDGTVACCCIDWRGLIKVGNLVDSSLHTIWQHPIFQAMRKKLYHGERDFGPCNGCDHNTYRPGLLPDKFGKQTLPKASPKDRKVLADALAQPPLTTIVIRPWEKPDAKP